MSLLRDLRGRDVILDTNLTLLHLAGALDPLAISRWKRTASLFSVDDYVLLTSCLSHTGRRITTPHIMAEVSHFLEQLNDGYRGPAYESLTRFADTVEERYLPSALLLRSKPASVIGLTDTQQWEHSTTDHSICLLSIDALLVDWTQRAGGRAVNFNHLRFPS